MSILSEISQLDYELIKKTIKETNTKSKYSQEQTRETLASSTASTILPRRRNSSQLLPTLAPENLKENLNQTLLFDLLESSYAASKEKVSFLNKLLGGMERLSHVRITYRDSNSKPENSDRIDRILKLRNQIKPPVDENEHSLGWNSIEDKLPVNKEKIELNKGTVPAQAKPLSRGFEIVDSLKESSLSYSSECSILEILAFQIKSSSLSEPTLTVSTN
jgi:hypothetical protein